jgi:YHS domain-containing protein
MNLIELFVPTGSINEEQRATLGQRLVTELIAAPGAPVELIERGRSISWLVIHEPDVWTVGGRPVDPTEPPRYLVRLSVPGGHLDDGMRAEIVGRITRVLTEVDGDTSRLNRQPDAWVQIIEVPDGNLGAFGHVLPTSAITEFVVTGRELSAPGEPEGETSATLVDPICGMTMALTQSAITLESAGVTYAFCSTTCRDLFAARDVEPALAEPGRGSTT